MNKAFHFEPGGSDFQHKFRLKLLGITNKPSIMKVYSKSGI